MNAGALGSLFALLAIFWQADAGAVPFTYVFSTQPSSGIIQGSAGDLIGWGYDLTNEDSSNWFVATGLSASSFTLGTPDGSYFDFPILAPGQHVAVNFDPLADTGLYGLTLGAFVLPGQQDVGTFTLDGQWWSGDPFTGGSLVQAATAATASFTVSVAAASVPLPGTALLLGTGLALLPLFRQRAGEKVQQVGACPG